MFSGTTTCLTYIYKNHLYCANLGDSRAVCFSRVNERWTPK
jgi:serine/threonine protein phosphatase PrpC